MAPEAVSPWVGISIGSAQILVGVGVAFWRMRFRQRAVQTVGTIVSFERTNNKYYPVVEFNSGDGAKHFVTGGVGNTFASYSIGQRVKVLYAPGNPDKASIDTVLQQWFLPVLAGGVGSIFLTEGLSRLF